MNGIATSVVVRPSLLLRGLLLLMAALLVLAAVQLLQIPAEQTRFVMHQLLAMVCVVAALRMFYGARKLTKAFVIDISGSGAIHLNHTEWVTAGERASVSDDQHSSEVVQLLRDSTLWSFMLLLRFRSAKGRVVVIPVLPDSLSAESFRALSIACRWIIRQAPPSHT